MKVLLFTLEYPLPQQCAGQAFYGGVANYYGNLVKHWPNSEILVLNNNDNKLIKNWLYPKWLPAVWRLWKIIKKEKINHIIVGHILPLGTVTYFVSRITKTPYSVILHGMDFSFACRTRKKRILTKKILNSAENIICGNSYVAGLVKKFVGDEYIDKIEIVNPGITARRQTTDDRRQNLLFKKYNLENKLILLSVGRLVKRKGVDKVLESLQAVLKKIPNLVYVIAGGGPDEKYIKYALSNLHQNAQKKVIFLGKISDEEKWSWLNLCDIFIMPARVIKREAVVAKLLRLRRNRSSLATTADFEGFGIVYLEANLAGKPVIAGNSGGVGDAVKNNINGLLVNPEDTNEISNAIIKLAQNENLRKKLGEQGRDRAIRKFSWDKQVGKIYEIITHPNPSQEGNLKI